MLTPTWWLPQPHKDMLELLPEVPGQRTNNGRQTLQGSEGRHTTSLIWMCPCGELTLDGWLMTTQMLLFLTLFPWSSVVSPRVAEIPTRTPEAPPPPCAPFTLEFTELLITLPVPPNQQHFVLPYTLRHHHRGCGAQLCPAVGHLECGSGCVKQDSPSSAISLHQHLSPVISTAPLKVSS